MRKFNLKNAINLLKTNKKARFALAIDVILWAIAICFIISVIR